MKKICLTLVLLASTTFLKANQIDIGIFASVTPQKNEVYIRPDFNISSIQTVTGILYTVRWDDPSVVITNQYVYPFYVAPQGAPVLYNGYFYQVFAAVPMTAVAMNANEEYLISSFTYTNGECANFEIINDEWTQAHNGNVYLELVGLEVTGTIYQPAVILGSKGGNISGNDSIFLGNSTENMTLADYKGSILIWQRKVNEGAWTDIPATVGAISYSEISSYSGTYYYRVSVQNGTCPAVYSEVHVINVFVDMNLSLKIFLEGAFQGTQMPTSLNNQNLIPLSQPYSSPPWNYNGTETVASIPLHVVDWIYIQLRESDGDASTATADKVIAERTGFILNNGMIKGINGTTNLDFILSLQNNLYVVVFHRNHLPVISANPLPVNEGTVAYDFSSGEFQVLGGSLGQKELVPGIWGMISGDGNADEAVDLIDQNNYWSQFSGKFGYLNSDYNLDGQVNNIDKNDFLQINIGSLSQVPGLY